jgi:hypothetical protein
MTLFQDRGRNFIRSCKENNDGYDNTLVLPVKDTRGIRVSFAMASPISAPPHTQVKIAPGSPFLSKTSAMSRVVAMLIKGVDGAPFLIRIYGHFSI